MIADFVRTSPGLLVSVRSAAEAKAALAGGADLIDVKEPSRGSLGRADASTQAAIVRVVAGRRPVSAALGELKDVSIDLGWPRPEPGVVLVKIGLADLGCRRTSLDGLIGFQQLVLPRISSADLVVVAYADWQRANAPPVVQVVDYALSQGCGLLIDTWGKDGSTLLGWLTIEEATRYCGRFRQAGLPIALAGSLGLQQIRQLRGALPDWFAVRGSVCNGGRTGVVRAGLVRQMKYQLSDAFSPALEESL
jgi:(5-formylfuran-3-yl)methyl phosphate synthase